MYIVYERQQQGTVEVARILDDGRIVGDKAGSIAKLLIENGYPDKNPDVILWGSYLWAAKVEDGENASMP